MSKKKNNSSSESMFAAYLKYIFSLPFKCNVTIVIGDCGAGKTSYGVRMAQKYMKKGYPVYSNTYIKGAYKWSLSDFMVNDMEDNAMIILDEAAVNGLASRGNSYKDSNKSNVIEGFSMYRHYKIHEIFVICPSFADIIPIVRARATRIRYVCKSPLLRRLGIGKYKLIIKKVDIPVGATEPVETFKFVPFLRGFYFMFPAFHMYDSFSRKELNKKEYKIYGLE